jgi:glutathione S-transferase
VSDPLPVLWQYSFSNYNEKVRWALDFKGIRHRRRSLLPGGPRSLSFSRGRGTIPVLDLDARRIVDSTRIIGALEERQPEPALFPSDSGERARALELEDSLDEETGHDVRRVLFWEARHRTSWTVEFMSTDQPRATRSLLRAMMPGVRAVMRRRFAIRREDVERSRTTLRAALDRIESERGGRDYLVGDRFTIADLTAAALLYPLVWPQEFPYELPQRPPSEFVESVRDHPVLAWISEVWRRHRPASAAI